ncbi:serine acetyltransferase [bacterium]|nr:MAG: serine acetyltransferase [bacterium]
MNRDFIQKLYSNQQDCPSCPSPDVVSSWFVELLGTLFPDFSKHRFQSLKEFELHIEKLILKLEQILHRNPVKGDLDTDAIAVNFFDSLSEIHRLLELDVKAIFEGDPAAKSETEVIRTYPGFLAIAAHRLAHQLYKDGVRLIPRMISEYAHSKTGIDIHPGAQIGHSFCIDHGTGVVIGETTVIGNNVKVYQGVTLGALSVDKCDAESKRHPSIGDHVVLYAGATILGGETVIGEHSIIGGNVWLTQSVQANTKIYYQAQMSNSKGEIDTLIVKNS